MKQIFLSIKLLTFGAFCDICTSFCTYLAERCLCQNKALNKKLLIFMSNFSSNNLENWQVFERKFLKQFLNSHSRHLP